MEPPKDRIDRLEVLRGLVERLCGADLTLAEAKSLRIQVLILLDHGELSAETDSSASSPSSPSMTSTTWTRRDSYSRDSVVEECRSVEDC
jgi:hypothetical protein